LALGGQDDQTYPYASGQYSTAFGAGIVASGDFSTSFGYTNTASGTFSTAFGRGNVADGYGATAFGIFTIASGDSSSAFGFGTHASGNTATAFGAGTSALSFGETVIGSYSDNISAIGPNSYASDDPIFRVGTGISDTQRFDAFRIYKNNSIMLRNSDSVIYDLQYAIESKADSYDVQTLVSRVDSLRKTTDNLLPICLVVTIVNLVWSMVLTGLFIKYAISKRSSDNRIQEVLPNLQNEAQGSELLQPTMNHSCSSDANE